MEEEDGIAPPAAGAGHGRGGRGSGPSASGVGRGIGTAPAPAPTATGAVVPVGVGRGRGRGSGRPVAKNKNPIGSSMTKKNELTNYFTSVGSSGSRPSTHGSGTATGFEIVQENEVTHSVQAEPEAPVPQTEAEHEGIGLIMEFDPLVHVVADPALRKPIDRFHPNVQSEVKRAYLSRGPTQPIGHNFPRKPDGRVFQSHWFNDYDWLEYSVSKDAAFCFYCFLFRTEADCAQFGHDVFTKSGYNDWKHAYRGLPGHVGSVSSSHNNARLCAADFKNQKAGIANKIDANTKTAEQLYDTRLTAGLDVAMFLISQGHAFRGHDESPTSLNKGNFLEMIDWYKERDENVRVAFEELCQKNARMTSPEIQHDMTRSFAEEVTEVIKEEIGDGMFSVLIDESRDVSIAEQMAVLVRLIANQGLVAT